MIEFIAAVYNEEKQLGDLINHVFPYVWKFNIVDDGSTDKTSKLLFEYWDNINQGDASHFDYKVIQHTGLPETVKAEALRMCDPDSWVIMLDADERFAPGVLDEIQSFVDSPESHGISHVWFTLDEYIDDEYAGRTFLKARLFKAWAAHFPDTIHVADWFDGTGANFGWRVLHKKTKDKQIMREHEYIETYNKLLKDGKITEDRINQLKSHHYFVK